PLHGLGGRDDFKPAFLGHRDRLAALIEPDDDVEPAFLQVQGMGVALGAKAEHGKGLILQYVEVRVLVSINFCRHDSGYRFSWVIGIKAHLRGRATLPVRVSSMIPKDFINSRNFSTLLSFPVISMVR